MMDEEKIFTGYCRMMDRSRMVTAELEDGVWYADCCYGSCVHQPQCPIAKELDQLGCATA